MKLYFLRHAIAVKRETFGFNQDHLRPLTKEGKEKFKSVCQGLTNLKPTWDIILTSPYVRARQTADTLAQFFNCEKLVKEFKFLTPQYTTSELNKALGEYKNLSSILLVGHEPSLSKHISQYISAGPQAKIILKKGGLALVEFESTPKLAGGTLNYLLTPNLMSRLGEKS